MEQDNEYIIIGDKKYLAIDVQSIFDSRIKSYPVEEEQEEPEQQEGE